MSPFKNNLLCDWFKRFKRKKYMSVLEVQSIMTVSASFVMTLCPAD